MVSPRWLYLEGYFSPLAPRGRALQPPAATHAWSLPSASRWPCPISLSMHRQMSVQELRKLIPGGTVCFTSWHISICEEGFLFRHKYLKLLFIIQCSLGDCSGEMLAGGGLQGYALRQQHSALEQLTEELFFFPYLILSCCSLSLLWGDSSQDDASFLCWVWAFLSTKPGAKPPPASVARDGSPGSTVPTAVQWNPPQIALPSHPFPWGYSGPDLACLLKPSKPPTQANKVLVVLSSNWSTVSPH